METKHRSSVDELKARADLRDIVASCWGAPKRHTPKGDKHISRWRPDDTNPDFNVWEDGYKDYGRPDDKGDTLTFIQREFNLDFPAACDWLAKYVGDAPPQVQRRQSVERVAPGTPPGKAWQHTVENILPHFQINLFNHPSGKIHLDYLRGRKLTDETIRHFEIGYNPTSKSYGGVWIPAGIVFPIRANGELWALKVRVTDPAFSDQKYMYAKGSRLNGCLFNADEIQPDKAVVFVEGDIDAMTGWQECRDLASFVTLGPVSNHLHDRWRPALETAGEIYLALDNDPTGEGAAADLLDSLNAWHMPPTIVKIPKGKDTNEFVAQHGGDLVEWFQGISQAGLFPGDVPMSWFDVLKKGEYFPPNMLPALDLLNRAIRTGKIDRQEFTHSQLVTAAQELGVDMHPDTLRNMLEKMSDRLFMEKMVVGIEDKYPTARISIKSGKGRPSTVYRVLGLPQMIDNLVGWVKVRQREALSPDSGKNAAITVFEAEMLRDSCDPAFNGQDMEALETVASELNLAARQVFQRQDLPKQHVKQTVALALERLRESLNDLSATAPPKQWPKDDGFKYRGAMLHEFVKANPGVQMSYDDIHDKFGIAGGSVSRLVKYAGLKGEPQVETVAITNPSNIDVQVKAHSKHLNAKALWVSVEGVAKESRYDPKASPEKIEKYIRSGAKVSIRFRAANKYTVASAYPVYVEPVEKDEFAEPNEKDQTIKEPELRVVPKYHYGPTYNPRWVAGQLRLTADKLGRAAPQDAPVLQLIEAILGHPLDLLAPLLQEGYALGASVRRRSA